MNDKPSIITNNIFYLKINSIENASALNIGENYLEDWNNSAKYSQGYGNNYGDDSDFVGLQGIIDDRDAIDSPSTFTKKRECTPKGRSLDELFTDEY